MVERGINEETGYAVSGVKFSTDEDGDKTGRVLLTNVRMTYPFVFSPRSQKNADGKENNRYEAGFLFDKRMPDDTLYLPVWDFAKELFNDGGKKQKETFVSKLFLA